MVWANIKVGFEPTIEIYKMFTDAGLDATKIEITGQYHTQPGYKNKNNQVPSTGSVDKVVEYIMQPARGPFGVEKGVGAIIELTFEYKECPMGTVKVEVDIPASGTDYVGVKENSTKLPFTLKFMGKFGVGNANVYELMVGAGKDLRPQVVKGDNTMKVIAEWSAALAKEAIIKLVEVAATPVPAA